MVYTSRLVVKPVYTPIIYNLHYRIRHGSSHNAFFITCSINLNKIFKKNNMRVKGLKEELAWVIEKRFQFTISYYTIPLEACKLAIN